MNTANSAAPHPATGRTSRASLDSLQVMRGIAALAVAVYHTQLILAKPVYGAIDVFGPFASRGWTGVNFFFVLSGFIIFYAHVRDIGMPNRARRYIWRRVSRIYPVYWIVLTAYLAAAAIGIGHPEISWNPADLISAYLLVRGGGSPDLPLSVAWTLVYEMVFYAAFLVLILSRGIGMALAGVWLCAIFYNGLYLGDPENPWTHVWNLYFAMGAAAFYLFQRIHDARAGIAFFVAGLLILLPMFGSGIVAPRVNLGQTQSWVLVGLGFGFMFLMLGAVIFERARPQSCPKPLLLLGDASYSIYLVHAPAISLMAQLNHRFAAGAMPPTIVFFAILLLSVIAGVLTHLIVEQPLLRAFRGLSRRDRATSPSFRPPVPKDRHDPA